MTVGAADAETFCRATAPMAVGAADEEAFCPSNGSRWPSGRIEATVNPSYFLLMTLRTTDGKRQAEQFSQRSSESEPTPPPWDNAPEFELPIPSLTPMSPPQSRQRPSPKPATQSPSLDPNPAPTQGVTKGLANGVKGGTRNGGSRSGLFLQQPRPPYPSAAAEMQITGNVIVTLTISGGRIVAAHGNGPAILASAAASWIRANWVPAPSTSGTYELPITFRLN
jgi:hypothetical protein